MKKILFYSFLLVGFAAMSILSSCSCKRTFNDQEFQGPGIVGAPAGFTGVTDAFTACDMNHSCSPLNDTTNTSKQLVMGQPFPTGSNVFPAFHATLSNRVTWFLTIKGNQSGAIKTFTATSQIIDETNALWMGRTDGNEFMKGGEGVTATLTFLNSELSYTLGLKILNSALLAPYNYEKNPVAPAIKGKLMEDYDQSSIGTAFGMRTTYADLNDGNVKASFVMKTNQRVQGDFSLYMHGTDYNGNGYLGGFSNENLTELGMSHVITTHDASEFYYNAYVYGYGRPNSCLMFLLYEDDDASGLYNPLNDDNWQYIQEINWIGWKLVSIKQSDFKAASNPQSGGNGNRIREPYKVIGCAMELQSYPTPGKEVEASVDYVYFSEGGPLIK
ncbi:MAG: hypothetical protein JWM14_2798 [Chitinophagaceae bacterium]|nr:hypothetical protein [Chitinophagaceae bacterium]